MNRLNTIPSCPTGRQAALNLTTILVPGGIFQMSDKRVIPLLFGLPDSSIKKQLDQAKTTIKHNF